MLSSFIVKMRSLNKIRTKTFASDFFKQLDENSNFQISKIFKHKNMNVCLDENEEFLIRIVALDDTSFSNLTMKLFSYKLLKKIFLINEFSFEILGIYSGDNGLWGKNFNDIKIYHNTVTIDFYSPVIFKLGSRFLEKFDFYLFLKSILKNAQLKYDKTIFENLVNKTKINILKDSYQKCDINSVLFMSFIGSIQFDISELNDDEFNFFTELIKYGYFTGAGYLSQKGYGMYLIK